MSSHWHPEQSRPAGRPALTRHASSTSLHAVPTLRQRSTNSPRTPTFPNSAGRPRNENDNPFQDPPAHRQHATIAMPVLPIGPTPHRAALMESVDETNLLREDEATVAKDQAMLMRGPKAEWTPTQQYLYSTSALEGSATAGGQYSAVRGRSPASSISHHSSPLNSTPSASRYQVAPIDEFLFVSNTYPEADDDLHDPGPMKLKAVGADHRLVEPRSFRKGQFLSATGALNLLSVILLMLALVFIFCGLPVWQWFVQLEGKDRMAHLTNSSGQVPEIPSFRGLIDKDTPDSALTKQGFLGKELQLVFSDEFNEDGRLFYPGMDPYWEATNNIEWYDPGQVYTEGGFLTLELSKETNETSHGFGYLGGMLQSWNQACFVGGYVEVAISLPGDTKIAGLWPAAWLMSNLGRAGYGGSLDGTWPYVYDTCDVGTLANQTDPKTGKPSFTKAEGDIYHNGALSYLSGQRFSRCTCSSETDHPGPQYANGTWKGRGASEIDIFEATVNADSQIGDISQSAQWAPFNPSYEILNSTTDLVEFFEDAGFNTKHNTYTGGATQQVTSGLSETDPLTYDSTTDFQKYGVEWIPSERDGWGNGKIAWTQHDQAMWQISDKAMAANKEAEVGNRVVTAEPMYILLNLGMSENFGYVDLDNLVFPSKMRVDYVRVYQDPDHINIGCDPKENPTADYIKKNPQMYYNANVTQVSELGLKFPKNSLIDTC